MDRVKLGRALGYGARHAGKALAQAVDAATSPAETRQGSQAAAAPRSSAVSQPVAPRVEAPRPAPPVSSSAPRTATAAARTIAGATRGGRAMKRSVLGPLKTFSSVVLLQITGSFFALLAMFIGQGLWKERTSLHAGASSAQAMQFYIHAALFTLFAYFTVSSFVRASRRGKR